MTRSLFGLEMRCTGGPSWLLETLEREFPSPQSDTRLLTGCIEIHVSGEERPPECPEPLRPGKHMAGYGQIGRRLWLQSAGGAEFYGDGDRGKGQVYAVTVDGSRELGSGCAILISHLLRARGLATLHASAVLGARGALLIVGPSGSGKSTTAAILATGSAFELIADDKVLLLSEGEARVLPYPAPSSLREPARSWLPAAAPAPVRNAAQVTALLFPRVRPNHLTAVEPVDRMTALKELIEASVLPGPALGEHFSAVSRLAQSVPAYRLTLGREWQRLEAAVGDVLGADGRS